MYGLRKKITRFRRPGAYNFIFSTRQAIMLTSVTPQITTYLGKRDFVDHIEHIDPVGKLISDCDFLSLSLPRSH